MKLVNNLLFTGNCRAAFERYSEILGGEIKAMYRFRDVPGEEKLGEAVQDLIMHAWLEVGSQSLMGCDAPPPHQAPMGGFSVAVHVDEASEARRIYEALLEGGNATMPFTETFWSPGFGMLVDRFGTPWSINTNPDRGAESEG
jgi:PhnB protein